MTNSNDDDSRNGPPDAADRELLPVPEPLVPAEPAPFAPPIEPSWRHMLANRPDPGSPTPDNRPDEGSAPGYEDTDGQAPVPAYDTTIGTLGEEPMGGVPREQPPSGHPGSHEALEQSDVRHPALLPRERPSTANRVGE